MTNNSASCADTAMVTSEVMWVEEPVLQNSLNSPRCITKKHRVERTINYTGAVDLFNYQLTEWKLQ